MNSKVLTWVAGVAIFFVVGGFLVWFLLFSSPAAPTPTTSTTGGLGTASTQTVGTSAGNSSGAANGTNVITQSASPQTIFKIADGPVTGAAFVQTFSPTTTLARYVLQENGHVLDQPIDVPGSLPRPVSNTTIPGTKRALWAQDGSMLLLQYQEGAAVKTVSLTFPVGPKTVTKPVQIQFLPDNVHDVALSPDSKQFTYLLRSASGVDGYIANADGSNAKKIFSFGMSQVLLSWPSANTLLLSSKRASGVPGIIFSVNTKTGGIVPLIYALGVTASANLPFTHILYQVDVPGKDAPTTYARATAKGGDIQLSFNPIPEKCVWSATRASVVYCATPRSYYNTSYLDRWHQGIATLSDSITTFALDQLPNTSQIVTPGTSDGGVASDIEEMAVSPDDHYLLFVKKGDRSLWAVRLAQ